MAEQPEKKTKTEDTKAGRRLDVTDVAKSFRTEIKSTIENKYKDQPRPKLVGFLANDDAGARSYAKWTGNACKADLIDFELRETTVNELEDAIENANNDPTVHGIMVYYPCFGNVPSWYGGSMDEYIRSCVSAKKDVEGLCHNYRFALYKNQRYFDQEKKMKNILPCTPLAIVKILEWLNIYSAVGKRLEGRKVTIINRSEVVGHPLAAMLANDGAEVYSVDINSIFVFKQVNGRGRLLPTEHTAESACKISDVIVTGVPSKEYKLDLTWVPDDCVVINVSPFKCVDAKALLEKPGVVYVPMVGKLTVAMLERNLLRLYENFRC